MDDTIAENIKGSITDLLKIIYDLNDRIEKLEEKVKQNEWGVEDLADRIYRIETD